MFWIFQNVFIFSKNKKVILLSWKVRSPRMRSEALWQLIMPNVVRFVLLYILEIFNDGRMPSIDDCQLLRTNSSLQQPMFSASFHHPWPVCLVLFIYISLNLRQILCPAMNVIQQSLFVASWLGLIPPPGLQITYVSATYPVVFWMGFFNQRVDNYDGTM